MREEEAESKPSTRPYFVPTSVNYESLPVAVKAALQAVVEPTYQELVLGADPLERSAGISLVFLLCLEVLEHFEIATVMEFSDRYNERKAEDREKMVARHLRLLGAKQQTSNFMMRLRMFRATHGIDQFHGPAV